MAFINNQVKYPMSKGPNGCSILHWRSHVAREGSGADLVTGRAALLVGLMLSRQDRSENSSKNFESDT